MRDGKNGVMLFICSSYDDQLARTCILGETEKYIQVFGWKTE